MVLSAEAMEDTVGLCFRLASYRTVCWALGSQKALSSLLPNREQSDLSESRCQKAMIFQGESPSRVGKEVTIVPESGVPVKKKRRIRTSFTQEQLTRLEGTVSIWFIPFGKKCRFYGFSSPEPTLLKPSFLAVENTL